MDFGAGDTVWYSKKSLATLAGIAFLLCTVSVYAQSDRFVAHAAFAEKIYLQLDADVYTTDQPIWFKAVVVESASHRPSTMSGVLHVELIGPDERVADRKRIKLTDGVGSGGFELKEGYVQGPYLLRAYTEWNKNFGADFIFRTYIDVFPTSTAIARNPMTALHLNEREPGMYWLQAQLNPELIDPEHRKQLTVYLTVDGEKDTLSLKAARSGYYPLDHPLPNGARMATVNMETQHGIRYTRTIALQEGPPDVQFFAESGQLVHGLTSKVGVKVLNGSGKGIAVSGVIRDSRGNTVAPFRCNHLGMGSFTMTADRGLSYYAVLDSLSTGDSGRYPLPQVVIEGRVLGVSKRADNIELALSSNCWETDSLFVQVSCRGVLYYHIIASLKNGHITTSLPAAALPEGIISFTLMDRQMQPLAERLFFNQRPGARLRIDVSMDNPEPRKRDSVDLSIQVFGSDGEPADAKVSVSVVNADHIGKAQTARDNLLTRLLLSSELRGDIEDPGYYFQDEHNAPFDDLDALMLTQGWRRYVYDKPQDTFLLPNEPSPYVSGKVAGVLSKKAQAGIGLTLMTFGKTSSVAAQHTDSLGRFYFELGDEFVDSLDVLIQSANKSGKNRDYALSLDERKPPEIAYDQRRSIERVDSVVSYLVQKRRERAQREYSYRLSAGEILLDEVLVERRALSPQQQNVLDRYGESDVIISGKAIQDKEEKWSYGLYSVLLFNFPDDLRIERVGGNGGYLRASIIGGESTLVVVDGIPVPGHSYEFIPNIPPSEVKSVELIRFAKNFSSLYRETYPEASPLDIPVVGSVIAIYTHAGNGLFAVRKPTGLLQAKVPVYSPIMEFYAPRYEAPTENDAERPDLRTLIHWVPELATDKGGAAGTSYYHSDAAGETVVIIEAISSEGEIGYQELVYEVAN
ncbi:Plug domain-containing protein [Parapedobacter sp. ISTM3]|uniref:Plug domain-containing protein n=1 Tax=Parapedobacter sp. ISTM3 TaxID=2800130 RepID=UPI0019049667|nr:Plug domain-containing protein [Parapedobacter sp. ISTM3]MBK1441882.1 Plug domain-containing protein [Parapedobacter sp. ISTM3]